MTNNPTPAEYKRAAWELIELADVSRHTAAKKLPELIENYGPHSNEVLEAAMAAVLGVDLHTRPGVGGRDWVRETEQSWRDKVPPFYLDRARRLLNPHNTPPDYVDAYRALAHLCPKATHRALDNAARQIADGLDT